MKELLIYLLYQGISFFSLIFFLLKLGLVSFFSSSQSKSREKYKGIIRKRLGLYSITRDSLLKNHLNHSKPLIWIHAVSFGEFKALMPLLSKWIENYPNLVFFVSHSTKTGYELAKQSFDSEIEHAYLPVDLFFNVSRWFKALQPKAFMMVEGDFWYGYLKKAKSLGCTTALINGKLSARSRKRYSYVSFFSKSLFSFIDRIYLQSEIDRKRLMTLVPHQEMKVLGNIKWDAPLELFSDEELSNFRNQLSLNHGDRVITLASSHESEEELVIEALMKHPFFKDGHITFIVAARHPERFSKVKALLEKNFDRVITYSQSCLSPQKKSSAILIDAMGILNKVYAISDLALVGGSWVNIGGHNLLEPLRMGVPTLYGPHIFAQHQMHDIAREYGGAKQVDLIDLADEAHLILSNEEKRAQRKQQANEMVSALMGSVDKTYACFDSLLLKFNNLASK